MTLSSGPVLLVDAAGFTGGFFMGGGLGSLGDLSGLGDVRLVANPARAAGARLHPGELTIMNPSLVFLCG